MKSLYKASNTLTALEATYNWLTNIEAILYPQVITGK